MTATGMAPTRRTSTPVRRRPMAVDECLMARALARVVICSGTQSKRIARELSDRAHASDVPEISAGEARVLRSIVYRYRRQISMRIVSFAMTPPRPLEWETR